MSAPTYAPELKGEHSWVEGADPLDPSLAIEQWGALRDLVQQHIGPVVDVQPEPWAPAMTFTRDLAVVADGVVVPLMPASRRGPFEAPLARRQLGAHPLKMVNAEIPLRLDGGNVLADSHNRLLIGVTSAEPDGELIAAVRFLEAATGRDAYRVPLVGGRFPHVDMAISDLNGRAWLVYPDALAGFDPTSPAWRALFLGLPVIEVEPSDGEQLACNLIVGDEVAIGPEVSVDLRRQIEATGLAYVATPLSEPLKAGGGAHCMTLELG